MLGKRAFANRLVKDSNVDVRHRLAKMIQSTTASNSSTNTIQQNGTNSGSMTPPLPLSPPPIDSDCAAFTMIDHHSPTKDKDDGVYLQNFCDSPINEIVDPIDYEVFVQNNSARISSELKNLLLYPTDDVQVEKYQPPLRTLMEQSPAPEFNNLQTSDDPFVQSFSGFSSKTLMVNKK